MKIFKKKLFAKKTLSFFVLLLLLGTIFSNFSSTPGFSSIIGSISSSEAVSSSTLTEEAEQDQEISQTEIANQAEIIDEHRIEAIPENEFLETYSQLQLGWQDLSISLEADQAIFNQNDFLQMADLSFWDKTKIFLGFKTSESSETQLVKQVTQEQQELETKLDLSNISLTTRYKKTKAVVLGLGDHQVKQEFVLENKTNRKLELTLKAKHQIIAEKIIWDGQEYEINVEPQVFQAYDKTETIPDFAQTIGQEDLEGVEEFENYTHTYKAGTHLIFNIQGEEQTQAIYDWSDIADLDHEVVVYRQDGTVFLELILSNITIEANSSYTIDPRYALAEESNYNIRYDGAAASDYLTMDGALAIGDLNGDSYGDLVLGAERADNNGADSGSVWVIFGGVNIGNGNQALDVSANYNIRYDGGAASDYLTDDGALAIGDLNGDSYGDLVLGAKLADNNGAASGSAWVMFSTLIDDVGSSTGNIKPLSNGDNYNIRYDGGAADDNLTNGGALAIGDLNGDSDGDLVLGAIGASNNGAASGSAWVMFSTLIDDVETTGNIKLLSNGDNYNIRYDGGAADDRLTTEGALAIGDLNGDSYGDLALGGAQLADNNGDNSGSAWVMFSTLIDDVGSSTGNIKPLSTGDNYNIRYDGAAADDGLTDDGALAIGDLNGDSYGDLVLGTKRADNNGGASGSVWVMFSTLIDDVGSSTGITKPLSTGDNYNIRYDGAAVSDALTDYGALVIGDLNGDSYGDLVLGSQLADNNGVNSGSAWVMFSTLIDDVGSSTGNIKPLSTGDNYNIRYDGGASDQLTNYGALAIGDLNGDSYGDLVLGANSADNNGAVSGSVWVMFSTLIDDVGSSTGITKPLSTADNYNIRYDGATSDYLTHYGALAIGDLNGDSYGDLVLGTIYADGNGADSGSAWVVFNKSSGNSIPVSVYKSNDTAVNPSSPGTEAPLGTIPRVTSDNSVRWQTNLSTTNNGYDSQMYKFQPDFTGIDVPKITIDWNGYGDSSDGYDVYLNLWNFNTSSWEQLNTNHCATDCNLSGNKTGSNYKDGNDYVWVWVKADNEYSPPSISNISASQVEATETVTWDTDTAADAMVAYDTTSHASGSWDDYAYFDNDYGESGNTSHSIVLSSLLGATTYYYRVRSVDADGDMAISDENSFTTVAYSCPFIFTYNGQGFEFIADTSTNGQLGRLAKRAEWEEEPFYTDTQYPHPQDYTKIETEQLVSRSENGEAFYDIRTTAELHEVEYLDKLKLWLIDHSPEVEVYPDYKKTGQIHTVKKNARSPFKVTDHKGNDVKYLIAAKDNLFWQSSITELNSYIEMKLLEGNETPESLKIVINRAKEANIPGESGHMIADKTAHLQIKNDQGDWVELPDDWKIEVLYSNDIATRNSPTVYGFDTQVIDLSGLDIPDNMIRLVIPQRAWDVNWIAVDTSIDEEVKISKLDPFYADLHYRGISKRYQISDEKNILVEKADYDQLTDIDFIQYPLTGKATRYGDVKPLLSNEDNKFVIMTQGDELQTRFAVPDLEDGQERDFIYDIWGYYKPIRNATAYTIEPLPFNGMSRYPYQEKEENYPFEDNQAYLDEYLTRQIKQTVGNLEKIVLAASPTEIDPKVDFWQITVEPGDSLWRISNKLYGTGERWPEIYQNNLDKIKDPNLLYPGQVLNLPHHSLNTDQIDIGVEEGNVDAPSITLTALSPDPSSDNTPSLTGTATDTYGTVSSVEYQVDSTAGSWTSCTADDDTFDEASEAFTCSVPSALSDDSYTIYIRATDNNSNTTASGSESSDSFTIDTTPPASFNLVSPSGYSKDQTRATLSFKKSSSGDISSYSVFLDEGKNRSFSTTGISSSGNGSASYVWKDNNTVKIEYFYEDDSDSANDEIRVYFKCLDGASASNLCPAQTIGELTEGKHAWKVIARDTAGNETSVSQNFYIDRTPLSITDLSIANVSTVSQDEIYSLSITNRMPSFSGKASDSYQGSTKNNNNSTEDTFDKVSSGPGTISLTFSKLDQGEDLNSDNPNYTPYLSQDYTLSDIQDDSENERYSRFHITTPYPLEDGYYQVNLEFKDQAGNTYTHPSFYLSLDYQLSFLTSLFRQSQLKTEIIEEGKIPAETEEEKAIKEGYTIQVKVVDKEGKPVQGAKVELYSEPKIAYSNQEGIATFFNVLKGEHTIKITYKGKEGEQKITLEGDTVKQFDFTVKVEEKSIFSHPATISIIGLFVLTIVFLLILLLKKRKRFEEKKGR